MHLLDAVGQLGILLLVGLTGTHLDVAMLRRRKATAVRISLGGLLLPLALGLVVGWSAARFAHRRGGGRPPGLRRLPGRRDVRDGHPGDRQDARPTCACCTGTSAS